MKKARRQEIRAYREFLDTLERVMAHAEMRDVASSQKLPKPNGEQRHGG